MFLGIFTTWTFAIEAEEGTNLSNIDQFSHLFSSRKEWFRKAQIWKHYANYFPVKLIKTAELDPTSNYLLGNHPHGLLCSGAFACFGTDGAGFSTVFPRMTASLLTLQVFHLIPGFREMMTRAGSAAATSRSIDYLLGGM